MCRGTWLNCHTPLCFIKAICISNTNFYFGILTTKTKSLEVTTMKNLDKIMETTICLVVLVTTVAVMTLFPEVL